MADEQKPPTIAEEAGLPANWIPLDRPPLIPQSNSSESSAPLVGSLPPGYQQNVDFSGVSRAGGRVPNLSLMPLAPSGQASTNSASSGVSQKLIFPVQQQVDANTAAIAVVAAQTWQGNYNAAISYSTGAIVESGGIVYISLQSFNINNTPASSPTFWQATGAATFLGAWSAIVNYVVGGIVSVGSALYIAIASSLNKNPTSTTGFWSTLSGNSIYEGAWSNTTAYSIGQTVSYTDGNFYICIVANTNVAPAPTGSTDWVLLGTSNTLIGAYNAGTAYVKGNEVTNAGNIFQASQATIGNAPPTPPATNAFWQLMGPVDLGSVPDGGSRFGQTASGLSYRPLTNPLTGHDAGANSTINIAAFTMRTSSKGDISDNSGSITALSYNTTYFIYYDDATLAGGAVTYHATTTKTDALNGAGRFYVGSITTPLSTGPDTIGNNDGGASAQWGQTQTLLGGVTTVTVVSGGTVTNPQNAIDNDPTTFADVKGINNVGELATLVVSGFSPYVAGSVGFSGTAVLNIRTQGNMTSGIFSAAAILSYSLNGGVSFTTIYNIAANRALTTDQITLGNHQNTALIQVKAFCDPGSSNGNVAEILFYEAWISIVQ